MASDLSSKLRRMIGPEIFKVRRLLCSSHSGKGTGLECSDCCADVAEERDRVRAENERLCADKERLTSELSSANGACNMNADKAGQWWAEKERARTVLREMLFQYEQGYPESDEAARIANRARDVLGEQGAGDGD